MDLKQYVVYPGHGLGQITELKTMNGVEFVSLVILDSALKIMVPKGSNVIRPIMDKFTAKRCWMYIYDSSEYMLESNARHGGWKRRHDRLLEKLKSNDPIKIAEVVAELNIRKFDGEDLSFGERKMLDAAKALIEPEIKLALK